MLAGIRDILLIPPQRTENHRREPGLKDIIKGQLRLAPVYDMLPIRWRPDQINGVSEYTPFEIDCTLVNEATRNAAQDFWASVATDASTSQALKTVALVMVDKVGYKLH